MQEGTEEIEFADKEAAPVIKDKTDIKYYDCAVVYTPRATEKDKAFIQDIFKKFTFDIYQIKERVGLNIHSIYIINIGPDILYVSTSAELGEVGCRSRGREDSNLCRCSRKDRGKGKEEGGVEAVFIREGSEESIFLPSGDHQF